MAASKGPNPFGWNYYSAWLCYGMTFIGFFMGMGIFSIMVTAPAGLVSVIPAFFPIVVAVRQWYLRGQRDSRPA